MTLTIDSHPIPLSPRLIAIITLLVRNQAAICQPEYGGLFLDLSPHHIACRPFAGKPLVVDRLNVDNPAPFAK